jgi:hypothetical protein
MVNGYIFLLKLVISCSQNRELIFCKNNEAIPRKWKRLVLKSICSFMEQIERKTANLRHFPNLSFAFVNLPGIFLFFINFYEKQKFNNRDKNILFLSRKVGRNFRNPSTKFALFLT